jgi:hypothetical protein
MPALAARCPARERKNVPGVIEIKAEFRELVTIATGMEPRPVRCVNGNPLLSKPVCNAGLGENATFSCTIKAVFRADVLQREFAGVDKFLGGA